MVAIKNIVLLATAATAAVIKRDAATIQSDLQTINSDTTALTSAVNAFNGGLINALPVQNAESQLDKDIKSATTDANNSAAVSDSDAQAIIDYINNTLEPNIASAISALESKKSQFQSAGLSNTVVSDLNTLKTDTDSLGQALISKAPSDKQSAAQAALGKIDSDIQGGITYYS